MGDGEPDHGRDPVADPGEAPTANGSTSGASDPDLGELISMRTRMLGIKETSELLVRAEKGGFPLGEDTWWRMASGRWIKRGPDGRIVSNWPSYKVLNGIAAALGVDVLRVSRAVEVSLGIRVRSMVAATPDDEETTMAILTFRDASPALRSLLSNVVKDVAMGWKAVESGDQQRPAGTE